MVILAWSKPYHLSPELGPAQAAMEITPQDPHDDQLADLDDEDMVSWFPW